MSERIDIAINESGASTAQRELNHLADISQGLSASLAASLRGRALRVGINTDKHVRRVAAAVLTKVVKRTPHATGAARANWETHVGPGLPALTPSRDKMDYDGDDTIGNGLVTINGRRRPGETIWISNGLDYIVYLNQGSSQQAPAMFVETAVREGAKVASNANLLGE